MRKILCAIFLALLGGCSGEPESPLVNISERCGTTTKPFVQYWPCVRAVMAAPSPYPDVRDLYLATGDYVSERVQTGRMTEAEARLTMAEAGQRAMTAINSREAASANTRAAGYAAWAANRPRTCVQHGYVVNCY